MMCLVMDMYIFVWSYKNQQWLQKKTNYKIGSFNEKKVF